MGLPHTVSETTGNEIPARPLVSETHFLYGELYVPRPPIF